VQFSLSLSPSLPSSFFPLPSSFFLLTMTIFTVKVKPNSKQQSIEEQPDGSLKVRLKSPPVDGKANQELIVLAKKFKVPKSVIAIKSGLSSKNKLVEIAIEPAN
jgi:uncharacterized protein (TIGR00251 family)